MKRVLFLSSLLLVLTVPVALAAGLNLAWGTLCYTENPTSATTFACDTNGPAGNRTFTCSFVMDVDLPDMVSVEWRVNGLTDGTAFPDWWKLGAPPDCRAQRATFTSHYAAVATDVCVDWTGGAGFDALNYVWTDTPWPGTTHGYLTIMCGTAIDVSTPFQAMAGQEYYLGGVTILNSRTVGTDACAGCSTGMLLALMEVTAVGLSGARIDTGYPLANQYIRWNQGGVPARSTTWGQVKGLYR